MPIDCLLVADDLTGACDAAVHFDRATVLLAGTPPASAGVLAISTETRDLSEAEIRRALADAAQFPAAIIFKKIDSTLRGNIALEIAAALDAFQCDSAIVCPAYPKLHRIVRDGHLHVTSDPAFAPIDIASRLTSNVRIANAVCDADLDAIAAATLPMGRRILWAGSAGLASALARLLCPTRQAHLPPARSGPALFCIGSDHPATLAQQSALLAERPSALVSTRTDILDALARGEHAILRIPRGRMPADCGARTLACSVATPRDARSECTPRGGERTAAALVLSGGDTASLVCRTAGVQRIELCDEIVPGVPRGILRGGEFDGTSVATKSGGFGDRDALIQVADFFTCPT